MIKTYAIKWDEKILVNSENKDSLVWYEFIQEKMTEQEIIKSQIETITNELVALNWKIKGWEELEAMWVADEDDIADIERYKLEASELINKRVELKAELKTLSL